MQQNLGDRQKMRLVILCVGSSMTELDQNLLNAYPENVDYGVFKQVKIRYVRINRSLDVMR